MTVIAYRGGKMACDSLCADSVSGAVFYKGNKIHRTKAGALVGCSGAADARAVVALLENVKTGAAMPTVKELCETKTETENGILVVLPNGEIWHITIVYSEDHKDWIADCCAITGMGGMAVAGCGGEIALAAMKSGKSPREAVALACEMNVFCAPPIHQELLHPLKPVPRPKRKKG